MHALRYIVQDAEGLINNNWIITIEKKSGNVKTALNIENISYTP